MRLLVCGGRNFKPDLETAIRFLQFCQRAKVTHVIHGDARGADTMARHLAQGAGLQEIPFPADWDTHKKAAGAIRNQRMLDEGKPDLILAFPGGAGTADMVAKAKRAGVKVKEVQP